MATATGNKWLEGPYAPIEADVTAFDLEVVGTLPEELDGRYLRNGPNPVSPIDPATHHWFTGDGMVHGVRLRDGRAEWYRARSIRSNRVADALGEPHAPGERHADMDNANTNVIGVAGRTFALVEAGARPVELTDELDTRCHTDLGGLPNGFTAHPKVDPVTGCLHGIAYHWALPHLQYVVIGPDAVVQQVEPIEVTDGPMVHDCSITERWMVVYDLPVTFDLEGAMSGARLPYRWDDAHGARVGLLPLHGRGDAVRWFEVAPSYVFHPLNAFDDGDRVVLDVIRHERMFSDHLLGPDDGTPLLWRWTLDTATGRVTEEQLSDVPMEFPRVDERLVGRPHRWGYASTVRSAADANEFGGQLARIDAKTGDTTVIDVGADRIAGEFVHVPRHADAAEDDGWLITLLQDLGTGRGELVVLPAAEPAAGPVARVLLPTRVPLGFHGNWVPAAPT